MNNKLNLSQVHIKAEEGCIGCTACFSVCPPNAITMGLDNEGFYVPVVDEEKCINCGKCVNVCPLKKNRVLRGKKGIVCKYMFQKNLRDRIQSTSGGVFFEIAKKILEDGGIVCGCIWDNNFTAKHICTDDIGDVEKMRGSKYVQSYLGDCFIRIKQYLNLGKSVLFSGTGCQTTALKKYLGEYKSGLLICCAVVCGGAPSPKVWNLYCKALEKKFKSHIKKIDMRNKKHGWLLPELYLEFVNGKSIREVLLQQNLYGTNFCNGLILNKECFSCKFKLYSVDADIFLSDDWGITKDRLKRSKNIGSSAIIALSDNGKKILERLSSCMNIEYGDINDIIASHYVLTKNRQYNENRDVFFSLFDENNIIDLLNKYFRKWQSNVKMSFVVKILYKLNLYTLLYNFVYKLRNR